MTLGTSPSFDSSRDSKCKTSDHIARELREDTEFIRTRSYQLQSDCIAREYWKFEKTTELTDF